MRFLMRSSVLALGLALGTTAASAGADTCSIRGVVREPSGQPAPSVWIVVSQGSDGGEVARSLTTDNGKYYLAPLTQGAYRVRVRRGDRTLVVEDVRCVGDVVHDIRLPQIAAVLSRSCDSLPSAAVTREQMAAFLVATFGLTLYGP